MPWNKDGSRKNAALYKKSGFKMKGMHHGEGTGSASAFKQDPPLGKENKMKTDSVNVSINIPDVTKAGLSGAVIGSGTGNIPKSFSQTLTEKFKKQGLDYGGETVPKWQNADEVD